MCVCVCVCVLLRFPMTKPTVSCKNAAQTASWISKPTLAVTPTEKNTPGVKHKSQCGGWWYCCCKSFSAFLRSSHNYTIQIKANEAQKTPTHDTCQHHFFHGTACNASAMIWPPTLPCKVSGTTTTALSVVEEVVLVCEDVLVTETPEMSKVRNLRET